MSVTPPPERYGFHHAMYLRLSYFDAETGSDSIQAKAICSQVGTTRPLLRSHASELSLASRSVAFSLSLVRDDLGRPDTLMYQIPLTLYIRPPFQAPAWRLQYNL